MKITVAVFFGGVSVEHEISVITALQAIYAMDKEKYQVVPVYITKIGVMYTGDKLLVVDNYSDVKKLLESCFETSLRKSEDGVYLHYSKGGLFGGAVRTKIDVAFPIVHGTNCEDGSLQGYLETLRLPYVGSDVLASAVGMDKVVMKQILRERGIPVVRYVDFLTRRWLTVKDAVIDEIESELLYPVIVKPANLGSSVGIKRAADRKSLMEAVDFASEFALKILVEQAVPNLMELNCSVLGTAVEASPSVCEEPVQNDEILSYTDKYMNKSGGGKGMSGSKRKCPAEISAEMTAQVQTLAVDTFKALGAAGVARIDFLVDKAENKIYVNEINTIPGSLSFYLWEATGKPFTQLCSDLIDLAFRRERERNNLTYTYDKNIFALGGTKGFTGKK